MENFVYGNIGLKIVSFEHKIHGAFNIKMIKLLRSLHCSWYQNQSLLLAFWLQKWLFNTKTKKTKKTGKKMWQKKIFFELNYRPENTKEMQKPAFIWVG